MIRKLIDYIIEKIIYLVSKKSKIRWRNYYWLTGKFVCEDEGTDTDVWALDHGYISVVPIHADLTHYPTVEQLNTWKLNEIS